MKRIVVASDGSDGGRAAVDLAVELAQATGAVATLACVRREPPGGPLYEQALRRELRRARAVIDAGIAQACTAGVAVESEILKGDPAEEIIALADARRAEMIVVGASSRGPGAAARSGIAGRIVTRAHCSVLVARAHAEERSGPRERVAHGVALGSHG